MEIVDQYDRERAKVKSMELVDHSLNRVWDAVNEAEKIQDDPEKLIAACGKIAALAGKAQQLAYIYKSFYLAWKENEPKPEAVPAPIPDEKAADAAEAASQF